MSKYTKGKANMEKIDTTPRNPKWKPQIVPLIARSREEGIEMDRKDESDIRIYTDGSGHDGGIGAAAVLYHGFRQAEVARKYLGREDEHTVFEAECTGQLMALQLLKKKVKAIKLGRRKATASIAVDNQASLTCHTRREHQPGATIIEAVNKAHRDITAKHPNLEITYRWVPGHEDIPGSDKADEEAKRAAEGEEKNTRGLEGILKKKLPISKAAARQELKRRIKANYTKRFRESWRYQKFATTDHTVPSAKYRKMCKDMPRNNASILIKLRTGHIPLNAYLHRFHLVDSPTCQQCEQEPESVTHFLKYCEAYSETRAALRRKIGPGYDIGPEILGVKKHMKTLFRYINSTGRFSESHRDLEIRGETNEEEREQGGEAEEWEDRNRWG